MTVIRALLGPMTFGGSTEEDLRSWRGAQTCIEDGL